MLVVPGPTLPRNGQAQSLGKADPGLRQDINGSLNDRPPNPPTGPIDQAVPESLSVRVPLQASRPKGHLKQLVHPRPAVQVSHVPDPTQPRNRQSQVTRQRRVPD